MSACFASLPETNSNNCLEACGHHRWAELGAPAGKGVRGCGAGPGVPGVVQLALGLAQPLCQCQELLSGPRRLLLLSLHVLLALPQLQRQSLYFLRRRERQGEGIRIRHRHWIAKLPRLVFAMNFNVIKKLLENVG